MAAGIDMAGLALSIFPIVIRTVKWYSSMVTSHEIKLLADSLSINKIIFRQSVEYMLRSVVVSTAELRELLDNPGGPAWQDKALVERLANHLGADYGTIVETMNNIYRTILKLSQKLPVSGVDRAGTNRKLTRTPADSKQYHTGSKWYRRPCKACRQMLRPWSKCESQP